jgi:hypothetical protein
MPRGDFLDYDPITGIAEYYEETSDGKFHIHTYQDVTPLKEFALKMRNEGGPDDAWRETNTTMYASLPMIVVHDLLKRGIDVFDQNDLPKVIKEINTTYSAFKTTYKNHAL